VWTFSDKFEGDVSWILKLRNKQNNTLIAAVLTMALEVNRMKIENTMPDISESSWYRNKKRITELDIKLTGRRKELVFVCDAKPFENIDILGKKFYRDAKRDCKTRYEYNIAILNKDPDQVEHTFYPALNSAKHYYKLINDTTEMQPLCVAMDYQWRITPMVVAQWGLLPSRLKETFNTVNAIHTLHPEGGIEKTVKAFCEYYKTRHDKTVYYLYDHTATGKRPDGDCFKDIAIKTWLDEGWTVIECNMGKAPDHDIKHEDIKNIMQEELIMFNELTTEDSLLVSIKNAAAKTVSGKTKKDKGGEKNLSRDAVQQTDYSDAWDQLAWGVVKMRLVEPYQSVYVSDIISR
jgi:hypothetical protein